MAAPLGVLTLSNLHVSQFQWSGIPLFEVSQPKLYLMASCFPPGFLIKLEATRVSGANAVWLHEWSKSQMCLYMGVGYLASATLNSSLFHSYQTQTMLWPTVAKMDLAGRGLIRGIKVAIPLLNESGTPSVLLLSPLVWAPVATVHSLSSTVTLLGLLTQCGALFHLPSLRLCTSVL